MILALIWKEFHEHVWKLLTLSVLLSTAMYAAVGGVGVQWETVWVGAAFLTPIWLAASTITAERSRDTAITLQALPISPWLIFAVKVSWALFSFLLPLAVTLIFAANRYEHLQYGSFLLSSVTLYTLILWVGMGTRREGTAAMVGIIVLLLTGLWAVTVLSLYDGGDGMSARTASLWMMPTPFGLASATAHFQTPPVTMALTAQIVITLAYLAFAGWRFSRPSAGKVSPSPATAPLLTAPSLFAALRHPLFWKERREQSTVLITTAIAGVGLGILFASIENRAANAHRMHHDVPLLPMVVVALFSIGWLIPPVIAGVLGVSSMAGDSDDQVAAFWHSRPIRPATLFWIKMAMALSGVFLLAAFFEVPSLLLLRSTADFDIAVKLEFRSTFIREAIGLPLVLTLAAFFAILLRRTLYAAILAVCVPIGILFLPVPHASMQYQTLGDIFFGIAQPNFFLPLTILIVLATVCLTLLARRAFAQHWRWG